MKYNDDGTLKYDMTEMKILLIDLQDNDISEHDWTPFANKESLRKWLIGFHSVDYETQEGDRDINELTLQELCEHGEWDYKILDKKENSRNEE